MSIRTFLKETRFIGPPLRLLGDSLRTFKERQRVRVVLQEHTKTLRLNAALKNSYRGKKCFIIATGPSIKTQDLKVLEGQLCISVSNFFVHPDFMKIRPEFHLFAMGHKPITEEQMRLWFADAEKHFPAGQKVLLSVTDKQVVEKNNLFKTQQVFYYLLGNKTVDKMSGDVDFTTLLPKTHTVVHHALYLALYLGCAEINLLGCDHDWITHVGQSSHFYEEKEHAIMRAGMNEWGAKDNQVRFKSYDNLWQRYKEIERYAQKHSVKIFNCTEGGLLDVFPRVPLAEAARKQE